jgi:hypothetical protein
MQPRHCQLVACAVVLLEIGCGSGPGSGDDAPQPDAGPRCESVCFRWLPDEPLPTPGQPVKFVYNECNPGGLEPSVCPVGFACGGSETFTTEYWSTATPVCAPINDAPHVLDLDLAQPPIPPGALDVSLALTLNGGDWPDGSSELRRAGTFRVASRQDPSRTWTFDLPSRGRSLDLALPPDTYDVQVTIDDPRALYYPAQTRRGELEVVAAGSHVLPFEATLATVTVRLDGDLRVPAGPHALSLLLTRDGGGYKYVSFTQGTDAISRAVLRPGTYRRMVFSGSPDDSLYPSGVLPLDGEVALPSGPVEIEVDVPTILTSGTVTVDGADLPASASSGRVAFQWTFYTGYAKVSTTRPASFRKRMFPVTYDVFYDSTSSTMAGIPSGVVQVQKDWVAAATLPIATTTIDVTGSVTLNGAALPAGAGGLIRYGSTDIPLGSAAGGGHTGRIFAGNHDVWIQGDGDPLPSFAVPVRVQWPATAAAQTWPVNAHALTVTMTHNGQSLPTAANGYQRGRLQLRATLLDRSMYTDIVGPALGALQGSVVVPDGTWIVQYLHSETEYTGTPFGTFQIGQAQVSGSAKAVDFDLRSVRVSGKVTVGGAALADVTYPYLRGSLKFDGSPYGFGGGAALPEFSTTGPATYSTRFVPGVYDVIYSCPVVDCPDRGLPSQVYVHRALRIR